MNQPGLFPEAQARRKIQRGDVVFSLSFDERKIIQAIIDLHNNEKAFDLDPTYSKGRFWQGLPQPLHKFDLYPQTPDTRQANSNCLPFSDGQIGSIMFDPPFVIKNVGRANAVLGKIEKRFFGYPCYADLHNHYSSSLREFYRILKPKGVLAFKCQDESRRFIHVDVFNLANQIGFENIDLFILGNKNVMLAPNLANQQHARKNHSYFLVFRKP